jgi:hypothetical protein
LLFTGESLVDRRDDFGGSVARDNDDTVGIANDNVAGLDGGAGADDRNVDAAGDGLGRALCGHGFGPDGKSQRELFRLFRESREAGGALVDRAATPLGLDANRRNLEVAIAVAESQGLLARPLTIDDLVTPTLAALR